MPIFKMNNQLTTGIVTTLRNAEAVIESFIRYHTHIGFDRLILFFDDPSDPAINIAKRHSNVIIYKNDAALSELWKKSGQYPDIADQLETEVMLRQILNVEVALEVALKENINWLLHIDIDELFYTPDQSVGEHFELLDSQGIRNMLYLNHEVIPEKLLVQDFFREMSLFKINPYTWKSRIPPGVQHSMLHGISQIPEKFFHYYRNGKSAVRVSPEINLKSVHNFTVNGDAEFKVSGTSPVILHYPCAGLHQFIEKYNTLGKIKDTWFGTIDINDAIGPLHLDSSNTVASSNPASIEEFYKTRVMLDDSTKIKQLIDAGFLTRIVEPAEILSGY